MLLDKQKTGELVRAGRLAKSYTQQQVSDLTGISLRSIQRIENGEVVPRMYTLKVLAEQLGFEYSAAQLPVTSNDVGIVKNALAKQIILSIGLFILLLFLSAAFLSQTATFPETAFETFLFWAAVTLLYGLAMLRIWK